MTKNDTTTQVSVRLPSDLVEAIDASARAECRNRSLQIAYLLSTSVAPARPRIPEALGG